jgi:hypothetical protein
MSDGNRRTAVDRLASLVPVDAVVRNVDVQALLDRIDLDAVLERIDMNAVVARVDLDEVVARMDLARLMEQSVRGAASGSLGVVRAQGVRLDRWITGQVDRVLRRHPGWRPARPSVTPLDETP